MGGGGTLHLAAQYPDTWDAIAAAAPYGPPNFTQLVERFRQIPTLMLQGDEDDRVPPASTRELVSSMKDLGMEVVYVEIRCGDHSLFVSKNRDTLSKIFSFFNIVQKNQRPAMK